MTVPQTDEAPLVLYVPSDIGFASAVDVTGRALPVAFHIVHGIRNLSPPDLVLGLVQEVDESLSSPHLAPVVV